MIKEDILNLIEFISETGKIKIIPRKRKNFNSDKKSTLKPGK